MTLPLSGTISAAMINLELGRAADAPFSLGGAEERGLAGKPTGAISFADFYGKSMREPAEGEYYSLYDTYWVSWIWGNVDHQITWFGTAISPVVGGGVTYIDKDGWRYHRGGWKGDDPNWWSDRRSYWGIWRERISQQQGTQIREPETGELADDDNWWWVIFDEYGEIIYADFLWNSDYTAITPGQENTTYFDHDGWRYHRGSLVNTEEYGDEVHYIYHIYRVKL